MATKPNETFSRVLIDVQLAERGLNVCDQKQCPWRGVLMTGNAALSSLIENAVQRGVSMTLAQRPRPSFLTREQAAEILGVTPRTITNMILDGRIKVTSVGKIAITEIDRQLVTK